MRINRSAMRAMQVFETFDKFRKPLSLNEITLELDLPPSSGIALLKTLVQCGYLEFDRNSRTYLPTTRIAMLSSWVPDRLFARTNIIPVMQSLADSTGQTVMMGTRSDLSAQYVHVIVGKETPYWELLPGTLRPLASSGIGLLLLSTLNPDELDYTIRRLNIASGDRALHLNLEETEASLKVIRRQGYMFSRNLFHSDQGIITILLNNKFFNRTLTLGIGGQTVHLEENLENYLRLLLSAVRDIEAAAKETPPVQEQNR